MSESRPLAFTPSKAKGHLVRGHATLEGKVEAQ